MKILGIDHIGIAIKDMAEASRFYEEVLGIKREGEEVIPSQKVRVGFFPISETEIELLESTEPDGPVARFINARGEGIQHIAFKVKNIEEAIEELKSKGIKMIDQQPRPGAGGAKIAFIHPKETNGVLIELCERD